MPPGSISRLQYLRVLTWGVAFAAVFGLMLGWYGPSFQARFGLPVLDLNGLVGGAERLAMLQAYGPDGRRAYLVFIAIDCVFPVVAAMWVCAVLDMLASWQGLAERISRRLVWAPVLGASADLSENVLHALLAAQAPDGSLLLAQLATGVSGLKYAGILCAHGAIVVLAVRGAWLQRAWRRQCQAQARSEVSAPKS